MIISISKCNNEYLESDLTGCMLFDLKALGTIWFVIVSTNSALTIRSSDVSVNDEAI